MALGMVDGLSVSRRRFWQSARQRRARRVIAQLGAAGKRQATLCWIFGLPNQKQGELIWADEQKPGWRESFRHRAVTFRLLPRRPV